MGGETPACILIVGSNEPNLAFVIPKGEEGKKGKRERVTARKKPNNPTMIAPPRPKR
jgi:hypothetical protein